MDPIALLKQMIETPSVSRNESAVADLLFNALANSNFSPFRIYNNIYAVSEDYCPERPTLLLNSHLDTVKPSPAYTREPYTAAVEGDRLYGLGSNDAGASVVSLIAVFDRFRCKSLPFNLILAISAEEEVTGEKGIRALLPHLKEQGYAIDMALVGEPTGMQPAIAERGLVVLDCVSRGVTGHAARNTGVNALYKALDDITRLRSMKFPLQSDTLGPIGLQVTMIEAGRQHNVVPDECRWVVDVRTTDAYTNEETVALIRQAVEADVKERSTRIRASVIDVTHPMVKAAAMMGREPFVSPTTADMAQMSAFPSLKMGPGLSERSHTADEIVLLSETHSAIDDYTGYINNLSNLLK